MPFVPRKERDGQKQQRFSSGAFPPHMTPLMLACINEDYHMVNMLYARGHTLNLEPITIEPTRGGELFQIASVGPLCLILVNQRHPWPGQFYFRF